MAPSSQPYVLVGAGSLTASVWKERDADAGWTYRFRIVRSALHDGRAVPDLLPSDVPDLVKLARVLAQVIADDGCVSSGLRRELISLAASIDNLLHDERDH